MLITARPQWGTVTQRAHLWLIIMLSILVSANAWAASPSTAPRVALVIGNSAVRRITRHQISLPEGRGAERSPWVNG